MAEPLESAHNAVSTTGSGTCHKASGLEKHECVLKSANLEQHDKNQMHAVRSGQTSNEAVAQAAKIKEEFWKLGELLPDKTGAELTACRSGSAPMQRFADDKRNETGAVVDAQLWRSLVKDDQLAAEIEAECLKDRTATK